MLNYILYGLALAVGVPASLMLSLATFGNMINAFKAKSAYETHEALKSVAITTIATLIVVLTMVAINKLIWG